MTIANPRRFLKNTGGSYCLFIQLFEFAQGLVAIANHLVKAVLHRDLAGKISVKDGLDKMVRDGNKTLREFEKLYK